MIASGIRQAKVEQNLRARISESEQATHPQNTQSAMQIGSFVKVEEMSTKLSNGAKVITIAKGSEGLCRVKSHE